MNTNPAVEIDLNKLEELAKAATPGPWREATRGPNNMPVIGTKALMLAHVTTGDGFQAQADANAEFIAAANPAAILALIAQARASQAVAEPVSAPAGLRDALTAVDAQLVAILNGADGSVYNKLKAARNDLVRIWLPLSGSLAAPVAQQSEAGAQTLEGIEKAYRACQSVSSGFDHDSGERLGARACIAAVKELYLASQPVEAGAPTAAALPQWEARQTFMDGGEIRVGGEVIACPKFHDAQQIVRAHNAAVKSLAPTSGRESAAPGAQ